MEYIIITMTYIALQHWTDTVRYLCSLQDSWPPDKLVETSATYLSPVQDIGDLFWDICALCHYFSKVPQTCCNVPGHIHWLWLRSKPHGYGLLMLTKPLHKNYTSSKMFFKYIIYGVFLMQIMQHLVPLSVASWNTTCWSFVCFWISIILES